MSDVENNCLGLGQIKGIQKARLQRPNLVLGTPDLNKPKGLLPTSTSRSSPEPGDHLSHQAQITSLWYLAMLHLACC